MHIFEQIDPLEEYLNSCREDGQSIALVPTMGGLHEGHLKLIDKAKEYSDMVVVSVFVNPTQFAENEDYEAYPKTLSEDKEILEAIKIIPNTRIVKIRTRHNILNFRFPNRRIAIAIT